MHQIAVFGSTASQTPRCLGANLPARVLPALGNYQGHVVGLLMGTELLDLANN